MRTDWPRMRDLLDEEREQFRKWMIGQTMPIIEGVPDDEQDAFYPWDLQRFREKLPRMD